MAAKKSQKETKEEKHKPCILTEIDIFKKAYNTATDIMEKGLDIVQKRIEKIVHEIGKKAFYFVIMSLAGLFLLFALSEFLSSLFPWLGKTSGYLIVAIILAVIGLIYKKGMD